VCVCVRVRACACVYHKVKYFSIFFFSEQFFTPDVLTFWRTWLLWAVYVDV